MTVQESMTVRERVIRTFMRQPVDRIVWQPRIYYWYYGTLALYQVQGPAWQKWNQAMQRRVVVLQRTDGPYAGSWDPDTVWGSYGGRVYSTALGALCLEVYYRYLPLASVSRFDRPQAASTIK